MFLEAQEDLGGIDGLYQIVGYLLSDSLLHDMLFFAFGDHHHRYFRTQTFYLLQRLQPVHTRHVLVKKDNIKLPVLDNINSVLSVGGCCYVVVFSFQINDIRLQQVYLIINPKYLAHNFSIC